MEIQAALRRICSIGYAGVLHARAGRTIPMVVLVVSLLVVTNLMAMMLMAVLGAARILRHKSIH